MIEFANDNTISLFDFFRNSNRYVINHFGICNAQGSNFCSPRFSSWAWKHRLHSAFDSSQTSFSLTGAAVCFIELSFRNFRMSSVCTIVSVCTSFTVALETPIVAQIFSSFSSFFESYN